MSLSDDWSSQSRLAEFDLLVSGVRRWVETAPAWPALDRARALWTRISPQLEQLRINLDRVLIVGVVGGTGTGKSTLLNALVGQRICPAGDKYRPTTLQPLVLVHPEVDPSVLKLDECRHEVHQLAVPMLEQMILVDCPDPDTQSRNGLDSDVPDSTGPLSTSANDQTSNGEHPAHENRNLEMLRRVLPKCDVLLCISTAEKYKTQAVAEELLRHAPGRQVVFIQTHAAENADITADWQRYLESQGFHVPRMFYLDSVNALNSLEHNHPLPPQFTRLVDFLNTEMAGRARHRILRVNALDLLAWFLDQVHRDMERSLPALTILQKAIHTERDRLFDGVRRRIDDQLQGHQGIWRARLLREVTLRWNWGPFAALLRLLGSAWSWLGFVPALRARGLGPMLVLGGFAAGKATADRIRQSKVEENLLAAADLGISPGDLAQSHTVLAGYARDAGMETRVAAIGPASEAVRELSLSAAAQRLYEQIDVEISSAIEQRTSRRAGAVFHGFLELLFLTLPAVLLWRLAKNFFYEHLWLNSSQPPLGLDFLAQSAFWILLWGLLLRGILAWRLQRGLRRDLRMLVGQLTPESTLGPLFDEFAATAAAILQHTAGLAWWCQEVDRFHHDLESAGPWQLGRLQSA